MYEDTHTNTTVYISSVISNNMSAKQNSVRIKEDGVGGGQWSKKKEHRQTFDF
jgi:hypothetical protein